jgi:glucose/arabinose dehydrogenase
MKDKPKFYLMSALIMIALALAAACSSSNSQAVADKTVNNQSNASRNMNESTAKNVEVRTDVENLEKQINLPARPQEVVWTAEILDNSKGAVPGPTDYRLTALLKYDEKSAAELAQKLDAQTTEKSLGNADVKPWFPDEVKKEAKTEDGRTYLEGAKYSPDGFLRAPYRTGNLIRIGKTNYFVLNVFSF